MENSRTAAAEVRSARAANRSAWGAGLAMSTLLTGCVFAFAYVCYPVNDDSQILRAFMGFQPGGPADFCMYVQAPVSWLLYGLGIVFPGVAWFTILQILFLWFSNAVIIKSILRCFIRRGKPFWSGIAAAAAFFALFSLYATARITYTVTAAMLGAAAAAQMMSINAKTASRRRYIWHSLPALVMMALAYGLRSIAVVPAFGYFCIVVAYHAFTALGPGKRPPRALRPLWITVLIVVVMLGGLYGLRSWEVTAKGQGDYAAWSEARTAVTDYLQPDKISGDVYEQAGWSDAEVELLSTWYTMDADYSTQAFETVAALAGDEARTSPGAAVLNLRTRSPLIVLSFVVLLCFGIVCLLWLRWFHRGEGFRQTAVLITVGVLCLELFSFLALKGRLPRHAAQVPVLPAAAVVFCLLPECLPDRRALAGWKRAAAAGTLTLLTAATLACAVPTAYAIRKVPSQWSYNVFADMDAQALARPDRLWIYGGDLINDTRLFPDVSAGIPDNLMFWGGWQRGSEEYLARLAAFGIDGHTFGAEDWLNPAVRYLSLAEEPNEALLTYLREKTGQTVLYEREKLSDGLYGYRFYLPE